MPYIPADVVSRVKQMDLYTYLRNYEPQELVHVGGGTYCTREHDSLKISNGKWYWFSHNIGGRCALDYLIKVQGIPFTQAVETIVGRSAAQPVASVQRKEPPKRSLLLPEANDNHYCWTDSNGKRHYIYTKTLVELREKEVQIQKDKADGIKVEAKSVTINDLFDLWLQIKRGIKNNTLENYKYMYNTFVRPTFGKTRIGSLKKSDVKRFYNHLTDERSLQASTIDAIHTVLHQVLDMAVDDNYIRANPANNVLRELKKSHCFKTEKRRGLTKPEQELLLDFLRRNKTYSHWYPIFAVMIGSGLRVGEVTGLRWCDIDLEEGIIDVNHNLVHYAHRSEGYQTGCYFNVTSPKTKASIRQVPMLDFVKEAFQIEKDYQEKLGIKCNVVIDGYTDFIFVNRFGMAQNGSMLNKAIQRIIRDCNDEQLLKDENATVLLPHFSCHSLRHTFTTRMCEAGVNVKVIQDALGHEDISTTLNIYADVTKELKKSEFAGLDMYFCISKKIKG